MKKIIVFSVFFCCSSVFASGYENPYEREALVSRIKPIGEVTIAGQVESTTSSEPAVKKTLSGKDVYGQFCVACHGAGIAGSPKFKDAAAWSARKKQGIDTLLKHAINGLNAMPPKGTCMSCSDNEIKAAIEYMLP